MRRRALLQTVAALVGVTAGCTGQHPPTATGTERPNATPTRTPTQPTTATTTPDSDALVVDGPGAFPHDIVVDNSLTHPVEVTITVETTEGTRLYRRTYTVEAETQRVVAGFTETTADPDRQSVRVTATVVDGGTDAVDFVVDDCHGEVLVFFGDDGEVQLTYSVC